MSTEVKKRNHYVDNKRLYEEMCVWKAEWTRCKEGGLAAPPLPDFVADALLKIARHLSYKPNFINYTFKEDMIGDALENCLLYIHNFRPERSTNVFAYITQIMHNAYIRRIQKESKQLYVKMKVIEQADMIGSYGRQQHDNHTYDNTYVTYLQDNMGEVISNFEERKRRKKKVKEGKANLDALFVEEEKSVKTAVASA